MTTHPAPAETPNDLSAGPYDPEMKEAGHLTSPTWELELFLSGAFVFATFQLPDLIEQLFVRLEPHAVGAMSSVLFFVVLYGKAIAFTLIMMFSVHLGTRAYWVALMGLHSVFPKGIRCNEVKVGPIARDVYRKRTRALPISIARLDNFCSIVFSVGLLLVLVFVFSTTTAGVIAGLAYLMANAVHRPADMEYFFFGLFGVLVGIPVVATIWDRKFGDRMSPNSRGYRVTRRAVQLAYTVNLVRFTGPMMWTLTTNLGRKKAMGFFYFAVLSLVVLAAADRLANSDRLSFNTYDFFGTTRDLTVSYRNYENQREAGKPYPRLPSIQSDIIKDPFVKLFVPMYPRRHNAALARECPGLKSIGDRGLQIGADQPVPDSLAQPVLSCMAKVHAVTLDGAPVPGLAFSFYEQPATGLKGVIAYIPVDSLHGRHTLAVLPVPPEDLPKDTAVLRDPPWKKPIVIPFWR